eukprot:m.169562 g.169562  ORF g.169562 m.169562 type:complete len:52 (+) comp14499_c0_seq1:189-344(+)
MHVVVLSVCLFPSFTVQCVFYLILFQLPLSVRQAYKHKEIYLCSSTTFTTQ